MLTTEEQELLDLAEEATPGPWSTEAKLNPDGWSTSVAIAATYGRQKIFANPTGGTYPHADQKFIAAANPERIKKLLSDLADARGNWQGAAGEAELLRESTARGDVLVELHQVATEKQELLVQLEAARAAARALASRITDLGAAADDNDPAVMETAGPLGAAEADLFIALGIYDEAREKIQKDGAL